MLDCIGHAHSFARPSMKSFFFFFFLPSLETVSRVVYVPHASSPSISPFLCSSASTISPSLTFSLFVPGVLVTSVAGTGALEVLEVLEVLEQSPLGSHWTPRDLHLQTRRIHSDESTQI